mgnify:CR=1 FL=1
MPTRPGVIRPANGLTRGSERYRALYGLCVAVKSSLLVLKPGQHKRIINPEHGYSAVYIRNEVATFAA